MAEEPPDLWELLSRDFNASAQLGGPALSAIMLDRRDVEYLLDRVGKTSPVRARLEDALNRIGQRERGEFTRKMTLKA